MYSEILDKHMKITVTERTCRLIDQHFGLDLYLLETPEIDLASKYDFLYLKLTNFDNFPVYIFESLIVADR